MIIFYQMTKDLQKKKASNELKSMDNLFKLEKENESTEEKITADIKKLFERKEEEYYKLVKIDNF